MSEPMGGRPVGTIVVLLVLTYVAHMLGQVVQIGGAQLAPSIVVYTVLALMMAPRIGWAVLVLIGLVVGLLTMIATSSPSPLATFVAHSCGFIFVAYLARQWATRGKELEVGALAVALTLTTLISWTIFAAGTWLALSGTDFTAQSWSRFGLSLGTGFLGWWLYGLIGVGIPTLAVGLVLSPALARLLSGATVSGTTQSS